MLISLEGNKYVWLLRACLSSAQSEVINLDKERNLAHRTVGFLFTRAVYSQMSVHTL